MVIFRDQIGQQQQKLYVWSTWSIVSIVPTSYELWSCQRLPCLSNHRRGHQKLWVDLFCGHAVTEQLFCPGCGKATREEWSMPSSWHRTSVPLGTRTATQLCDTCFYAQLEPLRLPSVLSNWKVIFPGSRSTGQTMLLSSLGWGGCHELWDSCWMSMSKLTVADLWSSITISTRLSSHLL